MLTFKQLKRCEEWGYGPGEITCSFNSQLSHRISDSFVNYYWIDILYSTENSLNYDYPKGILGKIRLMGGF